jgi:hypothetical protein
MSLLILLSKLGLFEKTLVIMVIIYVFYGYEISGFFVGNAVVAE